MTEDPIWFRSRARRRVERASRLMRVDLATNVLRGVTVSLWCAALLVACATKPPPAPVSASACPQLRIYTPAQQAAINAQLKTIPKDSPLALAFVDYEQLRDGTRACLSNR